jgi:hypothetical protein
MTAFTLVAEVAEQIISGVTHLTNDSLCDLQYSANIFREETEGVGICSYGTGPCVIGAAYPQI